MSEPIYVEVWKVSGNSLGDKLAIAYTKSEVPTYEILQMLRDARADAHNCRLEYLIRTELIEYAEEDDE